jgi:hypothetical protein
VSTFSWESLSAIATCLGTVAVIITVYEMKKQRFATYLPQLLLHNTKFYIGTTKEKRPIVWQGEYKKLTEEEKNNEQSTDLLLKISNVGLAAAVNIKISFEYDFKKIEKCIDDFHSTKFTKKGSLENNSLLYLYEDGNNIWPFHIQQDKTIELSVLKICEDYYIKLPTTIKSLINIIAIIHRTNSNDAYFDMAIEIPVIIHMKYNDISLNTINRRQKMLCNIQIMDLGNNNSDIRGTLEFVEGKRKIHLTIAST